MPAAVEVIVIEVGELTLAIAHGPALAYAHGVAGKQETPERCTDWPAARPCARNVVTVNTVVPAKVAAATLAIGTDADPQSPLPHDWKTDWPDAVDVTVTVDVFGTDATSHGPLESKAHGDTG